MDYHLLIGLRNKQTVIEKYVFWNIIWKLEINDSIIKFWKKIDWKWYWWFKAKNHKLWNSEYEFGIM
jgi:hypothetical protein